MDPVESLTMPENIKNQIMKVDIQSRTFNDINYNVVTDSWLEGGSKTRGLQFFYDLKNQSVEELSFAAFSEGYGQVIVSYGCMLTGIKCKIFINKQHKRTAETESAINFGADIIEISAKGGGYIKMSELDRKARKFIEDNKQDGILRRYLHIGLFDEQYIQRFAENLIEVREKYSINPTELWVASGVGVIANCISRAFPNVMINIVQTGLPLWKENKNSIIKSSGGKYKIWTYKDSNPSMNDPKIPYEAHKIVDSKIWAVSHKHMKEGALIWNVA